MFYQDGLTGSAWGDWANYTDSPLRAFEDELGVQAPVGFWDPVGYTRDGPAAALGCIRSDQNHPKSFIIYPYRLPLVALI